MTDFLKLAKVENNKARGSCSIATINGAQSIAALRLSRSNKKLYSSGAYYIGNLLGTQRDGWGKLHWSLGCQHEGYYCKNKRNGKGKITWKDGSFYKGDFKDDLRHGYGEMKFSNEEVLIISLCSSLSCANSLYSYNNVTWSVYIFSCLNGH